MPIIQMTRIIGGGPPSVDGQCDRCGWRSKVFQGRDGGYRCAVCFGQQWGWMRCPGGQRRSPPGVEGDKGHRLHREHRGRVIPPEQVHRLFDPFQRPDGTRVDDHHGLGNYARILQGRRRGYLFESNRHTHYSVRTVQTMVAACAPEAGITKRVYAHLLRHSIATILLDSGYVPIGQVQKFLGHMRLSTTQIYAETSVQALGDNYLRAVSSPG